MNTSKFPRCAAAILSALCWSAAAIAQTVNMVSPTQKALYDFNSQVNWVTFRPKSMDVAVALYGVKDGGKAFVCKSWANKQNKDATVDTMPSPCFCVVFNADGSRLAWCSWTSGKQIRVAGDLGETKAINCGKVDITGLAFDPTMNGSLASVAVDGIVRIWNSNTGRLLHQLPSGFARGLCVAYSADGRYLAASFKNNRVLLWQTSAFDKAPMALEAHTGQVNSLAFSPNSRSVATASADKSVILWDCATGKRLRTFDQQHLDSVECLAFTPDGKYLASGDKSGKVVFWAMEGFRPVVGFFPHRVPVYGIAISSDGEWMVTGSQDKSVRFFSTRELGYRMGRIRLLAVKEKLSIKIDGELIALDDRAALSVPPGRHAIMITTEDGSNSKTYSVDVAPESDQALTVDVKSAYGKLYVSAKQTADVSVANAAAKAAGAANTTIDRIMPGAYTVTITPTDSKYAPERRTIEIRAGETTRLTIAAHLAYGDPSPPEDLAAFKQVRLNPRDGSEMIWIPGGEFTMGRKISERDAKPPHQVALNGFWIYRKPVTVAQYRTFCDASAGKAWEHRMPPAPKWGWKDDHPMVLVSWQDAQDYGRWAFGDDQRTFLPTEAQYERAMQGPDGAEFPWGSAWKSEESINSVRPNRPNGTQPVGSKAANGYGLFDIAGNAWEWCADWYDADYYKASPPRNPAGPESGSSRVIRGAGWDVSTQKFFRSDFRSKADPEARTPTIGFRCAGG